MHENLPAGQRNAKKQVFREGILISDKNMKYTFFYTLDALPE